MEYLEQNAWWGLGFVAAVIIVAGMVVHRIGRPIALRASRFSVVASCVVRRLDKPLQFVLPLVALNALWQAAPDDLAAISTVRHLTGVLTIASFTWLATAAIRGLGEGVIEKNPSNVADNLEARRIHTQARVLSRTASGVILITGLAFILMTFPRARQLGASILASAGVAGLIVGIAARSVFSNLLAGLQIAMAQPLRIDDVLIVEGEWGRVEEITSTYVVMKLWDERRLIVPLQWFIEHPFQNWTRRSAELLGTVILWVDYTLPIESVRAEAKRLCEASPDWDKRVCVVQVTETSERCMQVRVLVSAASSGQAFDLRCAVREGLIGFIQREHPLALPKLRTESGQGLADETPSPA